MTEPDGEDAVHRRRWLMPAAQEPEDFRLLADASQEVLVDGHRPAFSQLAPVPLRQLGSDPTAAREPAATSER